MGLYRFQKDDAFRFARFVGIPVKLRGDELHFDICPYCHGGARRDKQTFSVNLETGKFKCLRDSCGVTGNMITLSRDFDFDLGEETDEYYRPRKMFRHLSTPKEPIKPKDPAVKYLESRGIPEEIAKQYEITVQRDHDNILVFPFYDDRKILQFVKYRKTDFDRERDKNKEWCEKNCKPILFGMKQCSDNREHLVITEGQIDSLSVAAAGIENAVSVPTGAKGFTWVPYCFDWVTQFEEIVVFGDFEKGSMTLLEDVKKRFPNRIRYVQEADYQGCKDANELLQKRGREAVKRAVENAVMMPVKKVIPLADVEDVNIYQLPKLKTGISEVDRTLCGGLPFGGVCVIAGKRGDGKSTLASQIMVNAVEQGYPSFAYSGELPNYLFKSWFDFQAAGRHHITENQTNYGTVNRFITNKNQELIHAWYKDRAFIYDSRIVEEEEQEDLLKTIERAIMQYGIRVVLIDNLMTAMYIDERPGTSKYDQQGRFVQSLTRIAIKYDCLIILVAHQRKNAYTSDANDEISGSGDITNLASITLSYNRGTPEDSNHSNMREDQRKLIIAKKQAVWKTEPERHYHGL